MYANSKEFTFVLRLSLSNVNSFGIFIRFFNISYYFLKMQHMYRIGQKCTSIYVSNWSLIG